MSPVRVRVVRVRVLSLLTCLLDGGADPYEAHFGLQPKALTESSREAVDARTWKSQRGKLGKLGGVVEAVPEGAESSTAASSKHQVCLAPRSRVCESDYLTWFQIQEKLKAPLEARQAKLPRGEHARVN